MSAARARKVLLAAIAVSLLIHLIFAGYIRWPFLERLNDESTVIHVHELRVARIIHTPPPTPVPTPVRTPAVRSSIAPPVIHTHSVSGPPVPHVAASGPVATPVPVVTAAPTPAPVSTHPGACVSENANPAVESTPDVPDIPPAVRAGKTSGTAAIHVDLDPGGHVVNAGIAQSSGNAGLDAVAMEMARDATYSPKYDGCKPVAGVYTFTVRFAAW
ncbi:MAG TPA: TonB family protein [Candidatus Baltobacteraceae bacterium]|jgi:TonB family protein|nr:TonB family protein [Candidatus Baltobacteraceae bacterium]